MMSDTETSSAATPTPQPPAVPDPSIPGGAAIHDWPLRPWLLAALLAMAGLVIFFAIDANQDDPLAMGIAAAAFFGPLTLAFTINRNIASAPQKFAMIFAGLVGLAMFGLAWRVASAQSYAADEAFWFAAGLVAVLLAIPLFQAGFVKDRLKTSYRATHFFVWTDAITAAGALTFVGISWALLAVLSELFQLLQIEILKHLMDEGWFGWMFSGAAFGAAFGVLRNQIGILGTLQNVVMLVLSILAIPLAAALALFLLAMIISGPEVLWNATDNATPILLACAVGAFVLTNAVVRDDDTAMSVGRVTRIAALVLALAIFPLAVFAAISMGTRIAQHGLSPERIWGLIAITVAVIYGAGYLISVVRGRKGGAWRGFVRQANLHMALLVCGLAIVLALPIFDFGAASTQNQLARLSNGDVSVEEIDLTGMRWDFGEAGFSAVEQLAKSDNKALAERAEIVLAQESRPYRYNRIVNEEREDTEERLANLRMDFENPDLRLRVERHVAATAWECQSTCIAADLGQIGDGRSRVVIVHRFNRKIYIVDPTKSVAILQEEGSDELMVDVDEALTADSTVEVREWSGRQIYVDGEPFGDPFE